MIDLDQPFNAPAGAESSPFAGCQTTHDLARAYLRQLVADEGVDLKYRLRAERLLRKRRLAEREGFPPAVVQAAKQVILKKLGLDPAEVKATPAP